MPNLSLQDQMTEFLLYPESNGDIKVEVLLSNETIWVTQERMAELFGVRKWYFPFWNIPLSTAPSSVKLRPARSSATT